MKFVKRNGAVVFVFVSAAIVMLCGVQFLVGLNTKYGCTHFTTSEQLSTLMTLPPVANPIEVEEKERAHQLDFTQKKIRQSGTKTCPSQYRNKNNNNEHSPLLFKKYNLMVCRSPKVGSNELRSVATAYETDKPFVPPSANEPYEGSILATIRNSREFNHYLYDDDVTRIMFVRHPVHRVLSAFLQTAKGGLFWRLHGFDRNMGATPESFRRWIQDPDIFYKYYHSECNANSTSFDIHYKIQHFAPPQHCRCGIHDCKVKWKVFKIEQHTIRSVLKDHLPGKYLPPANSTEILHKRKYTVRDYLTDDILAFLNLVTKEEREFFGYDPLRVDDL